MKKLSDDERRRYARQLALPDIGEAGQTALLSTSALIVGVGGLGAAASAALVAAGVGRIGIVEPDRVELSNLQRQTLYETADIGQLKAEAARDRLSELNPDCIIETHIARLDETNADGLILRYDIIVDGTDNYASRFVINDACVRAKKPFVYAAMVGFEAQLSLFVPGGPCYRCLVPVMPEHERSCAMEGIIGPLAPIIGGLQALEVMKYVTGTGLTLAGSLLIFNGLSMDMRKVALLRDPNCCH